uniref:hypothetical protein n=1 Tax=Paracoccus beibuensis TaxID=547602 RepID=UPI00223EF04B
ILLHGVISLALPPPVGRVSVHLQITPPANFHQVRDTTPSGHIDGLADHIAAANPDIVSMLIAALTTARAEGAAIWKRLFRRRLKRRNSTVTTPVAIRTENTTAARKRLSGAAALPRVSSKISAPFAAMEEREMDRDKSAAILVAILVLMAVNFWISLERLQEKSGTTAAIESLMRTLEIVDASRNGRSTP